MGRRTCFDALLFLTIPSVGLFAAARCVLSEAFEPQVRLPSAVHEVALRFWVLFWMAFGARFGCRIAVGTSKNDADPSSRTPFLSWCLAFFGMYVCRPLFRVGSFSAKRYSRPCEAFLQPCGTCLWHSLLAACLRHCRFSACFATSTHELILRTKQAQKRMPGLLVSLIAWCLVFGARMGDAGIFYRTLHGDLRRDNCS